MVKPITIEEFFYYRQKIPVVDVRSPGEFEKAHIPGSYNIPLFTDKERERVGITYKWHGKDSATDLGYKIVSPKLLQLSKQGEKIAGKDKKLIIHCWRGGMRSENMAWLFSRSGIECYVLQGGYKAYRGYGRRLMQKPVQLIVLGGMTGCGKTDILNELEKLDEQVLNLEHLAFHKGSVFGYIGQPEQYETEHFENLIFEKLMSFDEHRPVWVEDESRQIGRNALPDELYAIMRMSYVLKIIIPKILRIKRLVREYAEHDKEKIVEGIRKIRKRLGNKDAQEAVAAVERGDYETAVDIVLAYYDKSYEYGLGKRDPSKIFGVSFSDDHPAENAKILQSFANKHFTDTPSKMVI
ncbi:MAG: tRNA 2-selenouridine(34) synthase MnmH [Bacteroidales bacterium]